jgi:LysM repeat protein
MLLLYSRTILILLFSCWSFALLAEPVVLSSHQYRNSSDHRYYANDGKENPAYRGENSAQNSYYIVEPGDSVQGIADYLHVRADDIIRWNKLKPLYVLKVGQRLCVSRWCSKQQRSSRYYTVKKGDFVSSIARKFHLKEKTLIQRNRLAPPYTLRVGQRLCISRSCSKQRNPYYYTVKKGDFIGSIARKFHLKESTLIRRNDLEPPYELQVGQQLCVRAKYDCQEEPEVIRKGETYHYHVKRGDTLGRIAASYGVTIKQLMAWNQLNSANKIIAGQRLLIYPGKAAKRDNEAGAVSLPNREHVVGRYETLDYLSNRFDVPEKTIIKLNHLKKPYKLKKGDLLCLDNPKPCHSTVHIVAQKETLELIAQRHNIPMDELIRLNMLESPYQLYANQRICLLKLYPCRGATRINDLDPAWIPQFEWPLSNDHTILTPFGRIGGRMHDGIDIRAIKGTPVYAAADGKVVFGGDRLDKKKDKTSTYGKMVVIEHPNHVFTIYAHNHRIVRYRGYVKQGDVIAYSGDSGTAEVPSLHFELRLGKTPVNPLEYLPQRETNIRYEE